MGSRHDLGSAKRPLFGASASPSSGLAHLDGGVTRHGEFICATSTAVVDFWFVRRQSREDGRHAARLGGPGSRRSGGSLSQCWYYPAVAALSGAGAGLVISGGELVVTVSAGASAAPSGGAIASAVLGDAAAVLGLASRSVGHVSLLYGYDPEEPAEKLFVMSVVNAGTAMSASAKTADRRFLARGTDGPPVSGQSGRSRCLGDNGQ
jgi:hypothetical protein